MKVKCNNHTDGTVRLYGSADFEIPFLYYQKHAISTKSDVCY